MKHNNVFFMELSRLLFTEPYCHLSQNAKWLFTTLNELEQRYTGDDDNPQTNFFFRSNEELAQDAGMSLPTLKRAKKELLQTDLLSNWQMHFMDPKTGRKSEKKVTAYRILK